MTHFEAFETLKRFSRKIHIDTLASMGGYASHGGIEVSFIVSLWIGLVGSSELRQYEGESLEIAVGRAVADLTPPTATTLASLDASLATVLP